jgi:ribosomal protein S18 acetylase RimI-like enzyme
MDGKGELTYRKATIADLDVVVALFQELVTEIGPEDNAAEVCPLLHDDMKTAFGQPHVNVYLAELDGEPIGVCRGDVHHTDVIFRLRTDHRSGYIDQMYVRKAYRDRGVGAELIRMTEQWFKDQGIEHCVLHAAPKAVRFYSRLGFQPNREMFKKL